MRVMFIGLICVLTVFSAQAKAGSSGKSGSSSGSSHSVKGHTKKDGTYVAPSHATNPDSTKSNNWSQKGNVNPHTGKEGTKND